jgi:hypothetical protein
MPIVTTLHTILRDPDPDQTAGLKSRRSPVGSGDRDEYARRGFLARNLSRAARKD